MYLCICILKSLVYFFKEGPHHQILSVKTTNTLASYICTIKFQYIYAKYIFLIYIYIYIYANIYIYIYANIYIYISMQIYKYKYINININIYIYNYVYNIIKWENKIFKFCFYFCLFLFMVLACASWNNTKKLLLMGFHSTRCTCYFIWFQNKMLVHSSSPILLLFW